MRKVSEEQRQRFAALTRRRERRRLIRLWRKCSGLERRRYSFRRAVSRNLGADPAAFEAACGEVPRQNVSPSTWVDQRGQCLRCLRLAAPADFRFNHNPKAILRFIYELRRQVFINDRFRGVGRKRRPNLYIDLDAITDVDLEGALILAAELDRIRTVLGFKPMLDDGGWNPGVRAVLYELGLYEVIEAGRLRATEPIETITDLLREVGLDVVRFRSDTLADSAKAQQLRDDIFAKCDPPDASRRPVYDGLVEAVLNAVQHAYVPDVPGDGLPSVRRWWAGAVVDRTQGFLHLVVYDQGVGIPATLPRREWWRVIAGERPEQTDAAVIEGALEYGRSKHGSAGRGNGLWNMCRLTEAFDEAEVRFTSLKGDVIYSKAGTTSRQALDTRFCGTMIRWRAKIS